MPVVDPLGNLHVLIIDDDQGFLEVIELMLKSIGVARITRASSGAEALEALKAKLGTIDCTICDFRMANGNGLEFLQHVRLGRVKALRPDACIILLTASSQPGVIKTAGELDVNAYLVKPVTPDKLRSSIQKARTRYFPVNFDKYSQIILPLSS